MAVDLVKETLADMRLHNVAKMVLSPTRWQSYTITSPQLTWQTVKFEKSQKAKVPADKKGVYSFIIKPGIANHPECSYLLYVGKSQKQNMRTRFLQYFSEAKKPTGRQYIKDMIDLWPQNLWFCYAEVNDPAMISKIEDGLIHAYLPPLNEDFRGVIKKARSAWR